MPNETFEAGTFECRPGAWSLNRRAVAPDGGGLHRPSCDVPIMYQASTINYYYYLTGSARDSPYKADVDICKQTPRRNMPNVDVQFKEKP